MLAAFFFRVRSSKCSALDLFQFIAATKRILPSDPLIQDPHTNNLTPIFYADLSSNGDLWPSIASTHSEIEIGALISQTPGLF